METCYKTIQVLTIEPDSMTGDRQTDKTSLKTKQLMTDRHRQTHTHTHTPTGRHTQTDNMIDRQTASTTGRQTYTDRQMEKPLQEHNSDETNTSPWCQTT